MTHAELGIPAGYKRRVYKPHQATRATYWVDARFLERRLALAQVLGVLQEHCTELEPDEPEDWRFLLPVLESWNNLARPPEPGTMPELCDAVQYLFATGMGEMQCHEGKPDTGRVLTVFWLDPEDP